MRRRTFLKSTAATTFAVPVLAQDKNNQALKRLRVGVMGLSRGMAHVKSLMQLDSVEVAYVCDVDQRRLASAAKHVGSGQGTLPKAVTDFRHILDDPDIDAITIAAPNFWHAPATIMACQAGKHVYVEKPGSHNPHESQRMVTVAAETNRQVQMGNQRRSLPSFIEGIAKLHGGVLGKLTYARCWYTSSRGSIGKGKPIDVPAWLDYQMWQGPMLDRAYVDNLVHYDWHWRWHSGNGELGNNGVHALDIARWGLAVDDPLTVSYTGGRYAFDDDQETPDTGDALYDFGHCGASWSGSSCHRRKNEQRPFVSFYGDKGTMEFDSSGYRIFDPEGEVIEEVKPDFSDLHHFQNFANAIRHGEALNAPIADGQKSTMLCHLGNIAYREARTLNRSSNESWRNVLEGPGSLWKRSYRPGWEV